MEYEELKKLQEEVDKDPKRREAQQRIREQPEILFECSEEEQKSFIQGFVDYNSSIFVDEHQHFILSVTSKDKKKIDVVQKLLEQLDIHSLVYHEQAPEKMREPSRLLLVGFPAILDYSNVIGFRRKETDETFNDVLQDFLHATGLIDVITRK